MTKSQKLNINKMSHKHIWDHSPQTNTKINYQKTQIYVLRIHDLKTKQNQTKNLFKYFYI